MVLYRSEDKVVWGEGVEGYQEWVGWLQRKMTFKVGNGKRVKFWTDRWCGDKPLGDAFLMLFSIASTKDA